MATKKVIVAQTRSAIRRHKSQSATLKCLGLGRIGRQVEHEMNSSIEGMIKKVSHLVKVLPVD